MAQVNVEARFRAKVEWRGPEECWPWTGATTPKGYGHMGWREDGRRVDEYAHRVAYQLERGAIPEGLEIDHKCGVRSCCNPAHLEAVTHAENVRRGSKARQTHCHRGHEFTPENTRVKRNGTRDCRACARIRSGRVA